MPDQLLYPDLGPARTQDTIVLRRLLANRRCCSWVDQRRSDVDVLQAQRRVC
jgi:hypothetical protein